MTTHSISWSGYHSLAEILFKSHVTINVFTSVLCKRNFSRAFKMHFFGGGGGGELLLNVYSVHPTLVPTRAPFSPYMMPCFIETGNVRHRGTLAENAHS